MRLPQSFTAAILVGLPGAEGSVVSANDASGPSKSTSPASPGRCNEPDRLGSTRGRVESDHWIAPTITPPEGGAVINKVPGLISVARHAVSYSGESAMWPNPGRWILHTACQESQLLDPPESLLETSTGQIAPM